MIGQKGKSCECVGYAPLLSVLSVGERVFVVCDEGKRFREAEG